MQFTSLVGHGAQLYQILRKAHRTGEDIASDYFRGRKYIGSKDRKFISELLFSSLRVATLIEHCAKKANEVAPIEIEQVHPWDVMIAHCIIGTDLRSFPIEQYQINQANVEIPQAESRLQQQRVISEAITIK